MLFRLALALITASAAFAQGTKADYERAAALAKRTDAKVFRTRVEPHWLPGGNSFWYRVEIAPGEFENVLVDCTKGERRAAYEPPADATQPPGVLDEPHASGASDVESSITFINKTDGNAVCWWITTSGARKKYATIKPGDRFEQHTFAGHVWVVENEARERLGVFEAREGGGEAIIDGSHKDAKAHSNEKRDIGEKPESAIRNPQTPQSSLRAFIRENNVWLRNRETGEESQLTHDGSKDDAYHEPVLVAPNGLRAIALRVQPEQEHIVHFIESSPKDPKNPELYLQPKLHSHQYLKPGDRIRHERPVLFDLEKRTLLPITIGAELFAKPWSISDLRWASEAPLFYFLYNERGHQEQRVIQVDAMAGHAVALVEEKSATFVDYSQKTWFRWLDASGELLWASERNGWNHLYLYNAYSGELKNQITKGEWVVRSVVRVDEEKRQLWLRVAGVKPEQDPYYIHFARVNFDGSGFTLLTEGDGTHASKIGKSDSSDPVLSPNGRWLVDTYSRVDLPPVTELRNAETGKLVCVLEKADASALAASGWSTPERFTAKGRDGKTDIFGIIIKPSNFDPAKKYPVVEKIYAGPHGYFVPKEWGLQQRERAIAELGFIVVQIDGMGTNWRSRAFHDVAWRNLKDAGFPDRIAWMKAAAATRPWMDLTRVGIYGGSAGGQNALAGLLHHGDFYKVGVADCGCHDNRMDKIWWNEAWLGETGPWYEENSNVTHAAKLTGKLMLIVGEMDRNVDPASTMQVVNALEKANKDFDLVVVTGSDHGAAESAYGSRRRADFLVRHLLGVEPRAR
jgi:dipeptidyl aminopeptidase/acylaminoacyl peptidase